MSAEEIVRQISQLMCGNDVFHGNLVQYIKNEINGREQAETELEQMEATLATYKAVVEKAEAIDLSLFCLWLKDKIAEPPTISMLLYMKQLKVIEQFQQALQAAKEGE